MLRVLRKLCEAQDRVATLSSQALQGLRKLCEAFNSNKKFHNVQFETLRTRTNTNPNDTEDNAAGRSGNARALRKQSKCGMIQEGEDRKSVV